MGIMHERLKVLEQAMEKEAGIQPNGSVQAELRAYLKDSADYIHALESAVMRLNEKLEKSSVAGLHKKIDKLLAMDEKSLFERVFGRGA